MSKFLQYLKRRYLERKVISRCIDMSTDPNLKDNRTINRCLRLWKWSIHKEGRKSTEIFEKEFIKFMKEKKELKYE